MTTLPTNMFGQQINPLGTGVPSIAPIAARKVDNNVSLAQQYQHQQPQQHSQHQPVYGQPVVNQNNSYNYNQDMYNQYPQQQQLAGNYPQVNQQYQTPQPNPPVVRHMAGNTLPANNEFQSITKDEDNIPTFLKNAVAVSGNLDYLSDESLEEQREKAAQELKRIEKTQLERRYKEWMPILFESFEEMENSGGRSQLLISLEGIEMFDLIPNENGVFVGRISGRFMQILSGENNQIKDEDESNSDQEEADLNPE